MLDRIYDFEEFGPAFVRTTSKNASCEHPISHKVNKSIIINNNLYIYIFIFILVKCNIVKKIYIY